MKKERDLPFLDSLSTWWQQLGLGQTRSRNQDLGLVGGKDSRLSYHLPTPGCLDRKLDCEHNRQDLNTRTPICDAGIPSRASSAAR